MTKQPIWRKVGTVGDCNPIDYGGGIVFEDTTGIYGVEVEYYDRRDDSDDSLIDVYRFSADKCTFVNGILSDNPYHPEVAVWFDHKAIASFIGQDDFITRICSDDSMTRAIAWCDVASYHGFYELDQYPLTMTVEAAEKRLTDKMLIANV